MNVHLTKRLAFWINIQNVNSAWIYLRFYYFGISTWLWKCLVIEVFFELKTDKKWKPCFCFWNFVFWACGICVFVFITGFLVVTIVFHIGAHFYLVFCWFVFSLIEFSLRTETYQCVLEERKSRKCIEHLLTHLKSTTLF